MSARPLIRSATVADARAIARVHVETWRSAYAGILPDRVMVSMKVEDKAAGWRRLLANRSRREVALVAVAPRAGLPGAVVGFATGGPAGPNPFGYDAELHTLYVLPDWQEQGFGRALLLGCLEGLARQGLRSAYLWVLAQNPARFFYEAMGGIRIGERDEELWGAVVHEAAYGWPDLSALAARRR